jgi:hypothetical protein
MNRDWEVGAESGVAEFIGYSTGLVGRESRGRIVGVGTLAASPPRPLLLMNQHRIEHPRTPSFQWPNGAFSVYPWSPTIGEQVGIDAPPDTIVLVGEPPQPMGLRDRASSSGGTAIRAAMRGTLGPRIATPRGVRDLTAGHVAGRTGNDVHRIVKRWLVPTAYPRIGQVEYATDATLGRPGYDVGVVARGGPGGRPCKAAHVQQFQRAPLAGTLLGGVSGKGFGLIVGSLAAYADADGKYSWTNSWIMTPGNIGAEGDSGGSVQLGGGDVLGILVGGSRVEGSRNFAHLYVQDLESIERDVLANNTGV